MGERNFENRTLFHGDNLDFLRGINNETVDLIATDPPFNKGKDFHATPESLSAGAKFQDRWNWESDVQEEWVDAIKDDQPRVYELIDFVIGGLGRDANERKKIGGREDLAAFLCFMGVRLIEMRRVLKDTGSIYLHCDPTASHYLKALMDAIFGDKNFRNEVSWTFNGENLSRRKFARAHDVILSYTKINKAVFNPPSRVTDPDAIARLYPLEDERGSYKLTSCRNNAVRPNMKYAWRDSIVRQWRYSRDTMERYEREGLLVYNELGIPRRKTYADEALAGGVLGDSWADIPALPPKRERTGYPTQKPLALYERIIKASSNPGDVVLDPFCGCATTPIAAERLGRQWIGMDLWDGAYDIVNKRMEDNKQLLADSNPQIILRGADDIPVRTDGGVDNPTFDLELRVQRPLQPWERLTHKEMREILYEAQGGVCGGCGIELPLRYMELDHILPRADRGGNDITNRILICSPCNRAKSHRLTLSGLVALNRKEGWTYDADAAKRAADAAWARAQKIKETGII